MRTIHAIIAVAMLVALTVILAAAVPEVDSQIMSIAAAVAMGLAWFFVTAGIYKERRLIAKEILDAINSILFKIAARKNSKYPFAYGFYAEGINTHSAGMGGNFFLVESTYRMNSKDVYEMYSSKWTIIF